MLAMMLTAVSYGRMATLYPTAGSAHTYVRRGLNPYLGFLTGWAMFLDYLIQPLLNGVYGALTIQRFFPFVPYAMLAAVFVGTMTFLNLRGIRATARANIILLTIMCTVIGVFMILAVRYLFRFQGWPGVFSFQPFYDPKTFNPRVIWTATSYAALTYIGFDGVTTLAEDVENPKRNVMTFEQAGEILNFGAFLAFMGVNLATFWQFAVVQQPGRRRRWFADVVMPLIGFMFCLWIWLGLKMPAKFMGGVWFTAGLTYSAIKTRGFRERTIMIDFTDS